MDIIVDVIITMMIKSSQVSILMLTLSSLFICLTPSIDIILMTPLI